MYTFYILKQKDLQESKLEEKLHFDYLILFWPHDHSVLSQAKSSLRLEIRCFNFSLHHHYMYMLRCSFSYSQALSFSVKKWKGKNASTLTCSMEHHTFLRSILSSRSQCLYHIIISCLIHVNCQLIFSSIRLSQVWLWLRDMMTI